jgi:uncharacterized protein (DUF1697 family)
MEYFVFLKGINVGGSTKVNMKALRDQIKKKGINTVVSFLNSGNLLLETNLELEELRNMLSKVLVDEVSLDGKVIIRTRKELEESIKIDPFKNEDKSKVLVYYLSESVSESRIAELGNNTKKKVEEAYYGEEDQVIVYYHNGIGRSKFSTNYIDKVLGTNSTGRNMNTLEGLLKLNVSS